MTRDSGILDLDAMFTLSYGMYVVSSHDGSKLNGMLINAITQVTDSPPRIAIAINKQSLTQEYITASGTFAVSVLGESAPRRLITGFGFRSGHNVEKFADVFHKIGETGCPILGEHALAFIEAEVETALDCDTHSLFVGQVVHCEIIGTGRPMTYSYYREVLGGKTPPTAPTYRASRAAHHVAPGPDAGATQTATQSKENVNMGRYTCDLCGYVYDPAVGDPENGVLAGTAFTDLPDDWVCPECGAAKDDFSPEE